MFRPRHGLAAALALFALLTGEASAGESIVLRLASTAPEGSPWADACQQMASSIEKASKGQVRIKLFFSGLLGEELETAQQLQRGKLDIYAGSSSSLVDALPELGVLEMPFLFADLAEVDRALGRALPALGKAIAQRAYRVLGTTDVGFRHIGSKAPVQSLADLRRLRLRSQPSPLHARLWDLLGVKHHPIGLPAVARALEDGTVDAFDGSVVWMLAAGWVPMIKHLTLTSHMYQAGVIVAGPSAVAKLPKPLAQKLLAYDRDLSKDSYARVRQLEQTLLSQLGGMGVTVASLPPPVRAGLTRAALPVRTEWRHGATPQLRALLDSIERR